MHFSNINWFKCLTLVLIVMKHIFTMLCSKTNFLSNVVHIYVIHYTLKYCFFIKSYFA